MTAFLMLMAQAIAPASAPLAIASEEQARAMTPEALGDLVLAPGHPIVDAAIVGQRGMMPPPPGPPPRFDVTLWTRPVAAAAGDYCTRQQITVTVLNPGAQAVAQVGAVDTMYRIGRSCPGGKTRYGRFHDASALITMRELDHTRKRGVAVDYVDHLPPDQDQATYADGLEALRSIDLSTVSWAGPPDLAGILNDEWRNISDSREVVAFYAGLWQGIILSDHGKIVKVWLQREMPPPF